MTLLGIIEHLYLPLLTQETAVMAAAFTYGLRAGAGTPLLVVTDVAAVMTDLLLFFVPAYFFSEPLRGLLSPGLQARYVQATGIIARVGALRAERDVRAEPQRGEVAAFGNEHGLPPSHLDAVDCPRVVEPWRAEEPVADFPAHRLRSADEAVGRASLVSIVLVLHGLHPVDMEIRVVVAVV